MGTEHDRRRFLGLVSGSAIVALAGCASDATDPEGNGTGNTSDRPTDAGGEPRTSTAEPQSSTTDMSTVFHFAGGTDEQKHAVANVANLLGDDSTDVEEVVLVANGRGIKLLSTSGSELPERVRELVERGVSFRACENSMAAFGIEESDLIEGVETVPAGVGELTKLQARDGFAYIETP